MKTVHDARSPELVTLILLAALPSAVGCADTSTVAQGVPDGVTQWAPIGSRTVGDYDYGVVPEPNAFHTMHVGMNNTDNVWVALAPRLELDWVAETSLYVPEGPTYDDSGNLYFSPLFPQEDVSLVSLDRATGERNWAIPGDGHNAGSGAILILNDPEIPEKQLIYHASYEKVMAVDPDGTVLWETPTGLTAPAMLLMGQRSPAHSFGFNYHPRTDSLVGVTIAGVIFAFDRSTGAMAAPLGQVPGAPAISIDSGLPQFVVDASNALTDEVFGKTPSGDSFYETIVNVIFGGGAIVTNYFAIDQNSSRIFVAATAPDEDDGTVDGVSELGAIYAMDLVDDGAGRLVFEVLASAQFDGGTGSTPSVREDGSRVYVSDNLGNVIAYDRDLRELWRFDVGSEIAASIAVSPDNDELYAVTRRDVFKLTDEGDSASLDWTADLSLAFEGETDIEVVFQALTPTITANGMAVAVGGGNLIGDRAIMERVGVGLLDRETGILRSFTEGREESIAVTTVAPDGAICTANSPVRRASGRALDTEGTVLDIIGGISCYAPIRSDLLAREATCAAGVRAQNAATVGDGGSTGQDIRQIRVLIAQTRAALDRAVSDGDLAAAAADVLARKLDLAERSLTPDALQTTAVELLAVCNAL